MLIGVFSLMSLVFVIYILTSKAAMGTSIFGLILTAIIFGLPGFLLYRYGGKLARGTGHTGQGQPNGEFNAAFNQVFDKAFSGSPESSQDLGKDINKLVDQTLSMKHNSGNTHTTTKTVHTQTISSGEMPDWAKSLAQQAAAQASPQPRSVTCKSCGANSVVKTHDAVCEYCGGILSE